ncbi:MAG: methionyl-tRNA formyltransferase [Oscillospiraceae bacterium]|nr:methionyl-tRNA formyltransferase [Oscillospiraceae bacterium]
MSSVIFMGSPDFAVAALEALIKSEHYDVKLVVSQEDKPQGRHQVLTPTPVKKLALQHNIEVFQPKTLRSPEAYEMLSSLEPDFIVVSAYGKILPQNILDIPKFGCVNLHGSLLPKYRGAAPIQWSVINGDKKTGVTSMLMNAGLDTGDILFTSETEIGENETAGELFDKLAGLCPELLIKTLNALENGTVTPIKQNDDEATYVSVLSKDMAVIDWNDRAVSIHNKIRGLSPWPVAKTSLDGKTLKIFKGVPHERNHNSAPGTVYSEKGSIFVYCGNNSVYEIAELQLEGSKRMSAADFLRGHPIKDAILI